MLSVYVALHTEIQHNEAMVTVWKDGQIPAGACQSQ